MASVARDIGQHQRWLEHYRRAEERRARRMRLQALIDRLKLGLWRILRQSKCFALISLRLALSAAASLALAGTCLVADGARRAKEGAVWLRPRVYAFARRLWRWLTAFCAWILSQSRTLAGFTIRASSAGLAWLAARSRAFGIVLQHRLTAFSAQARLQAARLTRTSIDGVSTGISWAAAPARPQIRGAREFLSRIAAWIARRLAHAKRGSVAHRALAIRQSTALIRFEPKRIRLPALRAS